MNFIYGIVLGDLYVNFVIFWIRFFFIVDNVVLDIVLEGVVFIYGDEGVFFSSCVVCVEYCIGIDEVLINVVNSGRVYILSEVDWIVKVCFLCLLF